MQDFQLDFFDVPSPCRGVCKSDNRGYCQGCFRTRDERFNWKELNNQEKQKVIKLCLQREKRKLAQPKPKKEELDIKAIQPSLLDPKPADQIIDTDLCHTDFDDFEL
ncbi:DUF1289 domain-containing protein [Thalassotalea crassostreae]|uniref:DUF1289 domain-containing protein n=1 Tax=Thalassotalea crassostreae TaxID=1763536 RepID=UPI000838F743|nr:DUF1289 domain-containing protein [Thalassotalea crassostreae]